MLIYPLKGPYIGLVGLGGVWEVSGKCLGGVWEVSGGYITLI